MTTFTSFKTSTILFNSAMKSIKELLEEGIENTPLNILVFGPQVERLSEKERLKNLQLKRIQVRSELEKAGHFVRYAEDLIDPNLPPPFDNAYLQELHIMKEYDLIVNLIDSPGTNVEIGLIASKAEFSQKASLFLDQDFSEGLSASACEHARNIGADFNTYKYPNDLVDCHLLGFVKSRVRKIQMIKMSC